MSRRHRKLRSLPVYVRPGKQLLGTRIRLKSPSFAAPGDKNCQFGGPKHTGRGNSNENTAVASKSGGHRRRVRLSPAKKASESRRHNKGQRNRENCRRLRHCVDDKMIKKQ